MRWMVGVLAGVIGALAPGAVMADEPPMFVVGAGPIEVDTSGDDATVTLTVTNLIDAPLTVSLTSADSRCNSTDHVDVAARTTDAVTLHLPATCDIEGATDVRVAGASGTDTDSVAMQITKGDDDPAPDYRALLGYVFAAVVALVAAMFVNIASGISVADPLPGIDDDWNFNDSWASNLGLAATLFTAIFASTDLLEEILGDAAPDLPVLAVAGVLTAALIGTGPLWLSMFRTAEGENSAGGLLVASAFVLAGNLGIVATALVVLHDNDQLGTGAWFAAAITSAVLVVYFLRTVPRTLRDGVAEPPAKPPSDAAIVSQAIGAGAAVIARAIAGGGTDGATGASPPATTPPDDAAPRRRRLSAMP